MDQAARGLDGREPAGVGALHAGRVGVAGGDRMTKLEIVMLGALLVLLLVIQVGGHL